MGVGGAVGGALAAGFLVLNFMIGWDSEPATLSDRAVAMGAPEEAEASIPPELRALYREAVAERCEPGQLRARRVLMRSG